MIHLSMLAVLLVSDVQPLPEQWTCVARTPVLQRAYSGSGVTEEDARANALDACQEHALFGCYIARCGHSAGD